MKDKVKISRMELLRKVQEIVKNNTLDPADEIIACGEALVQIGKALKGVDTSEARAIMTAVQALN